MKTLAISYLTSVIAAIFIFLPSVTAAPLEVIPRICIYLGFPMSIIVAMILMMIGHLVGFPGSRKEAEGVIINRAHSGGHLEEKQAA